MHVALCGVTGAVGKELLALLERRNFPLSKLSCFASSRSVGKTVLFRKEEIVISALSDSICDADLLFFCAGSAVSREWAPRCKGLVIDLSSAFREEVPLVIPEINPEALLEHKGIVASPNCAATILLLPLFPIHRLYGVKRVVLSTYQAASGGGDRLVQQLIEETRASLEARTCPSLLPFPYAFNLYPHNSFLHPSGYVEEELKIERESCKILNAPELQISATCVRVPVLRAHAISANVELHQPFSLEAIQDAWSQMPGLVFQEERQNNRFPTPHDATNKDAIYCGRLRRDPTQPNTLEFWAVGDQLLKGAALNAVQIAEKMAQRSPLQRSLL
ncbi:MAG: aspartate-semialdehyde dehydrogenase [Verrucomicrobiota bacterium]|nr:aspartate-semialdehyde dehydrogenase [Verrucomicrobiota bacterium]